MGATQYRRHSLNGGAHNIVVGIFTGKTNTRGLTMSSQYQGTIVLGRELLFHQSCPKNTRRTQLRNLHKKVHPNSKKHKAKFESPAFSVFDFNGKKEFLALDEEENEFYVVRENDIVSHFDSIENSTTETYEVNNDVELNDGEKWKANPETISGVQNLQILISDFDQTENSDSLSKLSNSLETEFKLIFKNCTMTGAAHDQLHNYLLPMLGMMKKLKTPPLENQQEQLVKMESYLLRFDEYFN